MCTRRLSEDRFVYPAVMANDAAAFESMVLAQAPPGAVMIGASLSPDGTYGAALTFLPSANYLMDDVFVRDGGDWRPYSGGSGGDISWTALGEGHGGVLRFGDEAPSRAAVAQVRYKGVEYRVPVRHGHFLFVAWNVEAPNVAPYERPGLIRFE
jgi:hypothetical protein